MRTKTTCSWCHSENYVSDRTCHACGHDAQVCRMDCRCPRCADSADAKDDDDEDK